MSEIEVILACLAAVGAIIVAMIYTPKRYLDCAAPIYVTIGVFAVVTCIYIVGGIK